MFLHYLPDAVNAVQINISNIIGKRKKETLKVGLPKNVFPFST